MEPSQLVFALVFFFGLALFLVLKRRQVVIEWLLYPVLYFAMYRSSWGLNAMDTLAQKWRACLKVLGAIAIGIGFIGMGLISYQLAKNIVGILTKSSGASTVGIVQPFAQNLPGTIFVPFVYFAVSIFVIAVLHEFSHGVMARVHNCRVRSSGFAFLGFLIPVIPAAFVEPDEKEMAARPAHAQMAVIAAGAVSNILFALLLFVVIVYAIQPLGDSLIHPLGVEVVTVSKNSPADLAGLKPGELITLLGNMPVKDSKQLLDALTLMHAGDHADLITNVSAHSVVMQGHPSKPGKPYFGVQVTNRFEISDTAKARYGTVLPAIALWVSGLLFWLFNLSLGIGLFNLVPLGPIDGGKLLQLSLLTWCEKDTARKIWKTVSIVFLLAILFNVGAAFFI